MFLLLSLTVLRQYFSLFHRAKRLFKTAEPPEAYRIRSAYGLLIMAEGLKHGRRRRGNLFNLCNLWFPILIVFYSLRGFMFS